MIIERQKNGISSENKYRLRGKSISGIRLEVMPRAPITIGYGFPLNPDRSQDKQRFFYWGFVV